MCNTEQPQPQPDPKTELTPTERGGIVALHLAKRNNLTTREVAKVSGLSYRGAWELMQRLSRVMDIRFIYGEGTREDPGIWHLDDEFRDYP